MVQAKAMEPIVVEPVVNREKLRELLALQAEYPTLDFKESCDLRRECTGRKRNQVELAKDVAAMSIHGGFLVIGVDKRGTPTGALSEPQAKMFDEAKLRPMLLTWLPDTLVIRSQDHEVDGSLVVLLYVAPDPVGCVFFRADGQYPHGKDTKTVFRQGEVFFRSGTESRRMNQQGLEKVIARRVRIERERWERDHAVEYRRLADQLKSGTTGQRVAAGPAAEFSLALEPEVLTAAAIELLRANDDIPLRLLLDSASSRARQLLREGDVPGLTGLVDRLACLAATFLTIDRQEWFKRVVKTLTAIYSLPVRDVGVAHGHVTRDIAAFWLMVTERVFGLGSLAVRRENWPAVRALAAYQLPLEGGMQRTWFRQTLVMAGRAGLLESQQGAQRIKVSLLSLARDVVRRSGCLRPDLDREDEQIMSSLTQFDFLACLVGIDVNGGFYPSFARFYAHRTSPIAEQLVQESLLRSKVFHGDDLDLARALAEVDQVAQQEGFAYDGWEGYTPMVHDFVIAHLPTAN